MRGNDLKTKLVSYALETLPLLTDEQKAKLKANASRPDSEIDTSDTPELTDEQWKNAVSSGLYRTGHYRTGLYRAGLDRPVKDQITARVDAGVAQIAGPRLPIPHQRHPSPRDGRGAQSSDRKINVLRKRPAVVPQRTRFNPV
jgi:hypothetical protein